jgi:transcriptional regulator with XRE-family HTH domain
MFTERIGATLHRLRTGKCLSVRDICDGIITPPHYYNVEKWLSEISASFLFEILRRMHVSVAEFGELLEINMEADCGPIEQHDIHDEINDADEIARIKRMLFEKDELFYYEVAVLNNYIPSLPVDYILEMLPALEKSMSEQKIFDYGAPAKAKVVLNLISRLINDGLLEIARSVYTEFSIFLTNTTPRMSLVSLKHLFSIRYSLYNNETDKCFLNVTSKLLE